MHNKKCGFAKLLSLLVFVSPMSNAMDLIQWASCTDEGVTKLETGLGAAVDDIVHIQSSFRSAVSDLLDSRWTFVYGQGSGTFTNFDDKIITIQSGTPLEITVASLAHELGHAKRGVWQDWSSKDAYVRTMCGGEGAALLMNIRLQRAVLDCSAAGFDMGIMTSTDSKAELLAMYEELLKDPLAEYAFNRDAGYLYCERNRTSIDQKPYLDYYGDWYDAHKPPTGQTIVTPLKAITLTALASAALQAPPELVAQEKSIFWTTLQKVAEHSRPGVTIEKFAEVWPADKFDATGPGRRSLYSSEYKLSDHLSVKSELRAYGLNDATRLGLAIMDIDGVCITLDEVKQHYPELHIGPPPHPDSAAPTYWRSYGSWGRLSFKFKPDNPKCLAGIVVDPYETAPASTPISPASVQPLPH